MAEDRERCLEIVRQWSQFPQLGLTIIAFSPGSIRWPRWHHMYDLCTQARRPHPWECTQIHDYEEVGTIIISTMHLIFLPLSSPDVTFCGYSVPHPSEPKINLRVQTNGMHITWDSVYGTTLILCIITHTSTRCSSHRRIEKRSGRSSGIVCPCPA